MIFLKVIITLLLLISGSSAAAFSAPLTGVDGVEDSYAVSADFEQGSYYTSDSTLSSPAVFFTPGISHLGLFAFYYSSTYREQLALHYLRYSKTISPSLDIPEIIFPFHSFL